MCPTTANAIPLPAQTTDTKAATMQSRKRSYQEADSTPAERPKEDSLVHRLRNSFYFANLYQWICIFGKVVKIDDNLDIAVRSPTTSPDGSKHQPALSVLIPVNRTSKRNV